MLVNSDPVNTVRRMLRKVKQYMVLRKQIAQSSLQSVSPRGLVFVVAVLLGLWTWGYVPETWAQERLFVSNYNGQTITVYPRTVNGDVAPNQVFTAGLSGPHQIAVWRSQRELFVANNLSYTITVYNSDDGSLKRTIAGSNTGLNRPTGVAIDDVNEELYVANDFGNSITVYDLNSDGDVPPKRTIIGGSTGLGGPVGVAVDLVHNELFVANYKVASGGSITVYSRTANGNVAPVRTIQGNATGLNLPQGLALTLDLVHDEIVVASSAFTTPNAGSIVVFRRTDVGDVNPIRKLEGSSTKLCNPIGLALDLANDELVVANSNFGNGTCDESVTTYARTASGNQPPLRTLMGSGVVSGLSNPTGVAITSGEACPTGPIGGIDLGDLPQYLFVFTNGSQDANWQGATKGFLGDVVVAGKIAKERTSGGVPYAGTISTNDTTLGAWQGIADQNAGQASVKTGKTSLVSTLESSLLWAFTQINKKPATPGYESRSATSLHGLDIKNNKAETIVINVTSGFQVSSRINITGDPGDVFVLRWDTDANFTNGYQGEVKFQSGGAIVPLGGLTAGNFIHVAGTINSSGGGSTPPAPYPQGPRVNNGTGDLIQGATDFSGGGFFTGYWLTTGDPISKDTHSLSNGIFVGGWYSLTDKFSMTSGTSGVHVCPQSPQKKY